MEAVVDLLITLFLSTVPTLLFLGLWHGLMYLRDDDLIEEARRLEAQRNRRIEAQRGAHRAARSESGSGGSGGHAPATSGSAVCESCGHENVAEVKYCWNCLDRLPEE